MLGSSKGSKEGSIISTSTAGRVLTAAQARRKALLRKKARTAGEDGSVISGSVSTGESDELEGSTGDDDESSAASSSKKETRRQRKEALAKEANKKVAEARRKEQAARMAAKMMEAAEVLTEEQIEEKHDIKASEESRLDAALSEKQRLTEELEDTKLRLQRFEDGELVLSLLEQVELRQAKHQLKSDLMEATFTAHRAQHSLQRLTKEIEIGREVNDATPELDKDEFVSSEEEETPEQQALREKLEEEAAVKKEQRTNRKWRRNMRRKKREAKAAHELHKAERQHAKQDEINRKKQAIADEKQRRVQEAILKLDSIGDNASGFLKEKRQREIDVLKEKIEKHVDKQETV